MAGRDFIPDIVGTNDSDNNSWVFWPFIYRSQINGNDSDNDILALAGNDIVYGLGGQDWIDAGSGHDQVFGGFGNDTILGGTGNDSLYGDAGNDDLNGGLDNDVLYGGSGNDQLRADSGTDTLYGGTGNDRYYIGPFGHTSEVIEAWGGGNDTVHAFISDYTLGANVENLVLEPLPTTIYQPTADPDIGTIIHIHYAWPVTRVGRGNSLDNVITGTQASGYNNHLEGLAGNDTLYGGLGNDTLYGGTEHDYLSGGSGDDLLFGEAGNDSVFGGIGNDFLFSGAQNDLLNGGNGNDVLFGEDHADTLFGGNGDDTLYGGNFALFGADGDTGNDFLSGGNGNDVLDGGLGSDSLRGEAGHDTLTGGGNDDQFVFASSRFFVATDLGVDFITDFNRVAGDRIVLSKTTFAALGSVSGLGFSVASEFATVTTDAAAATSTALIVYNSANGKLFYNENGSGAGFYTSILDLLPRGGHFATLQGAPALAASDFQLQV